jgi:hypothetical protein
VIRNLYSAFTIDSSTNMLNAVQKSKNNCGVNDLSVTVMISNRKCHENVCYFNHNGFLISEQRRYVVPSNKFGIRVGCDLYILSINGW